MSAYDEAQKFLQRLSKRDPLNIQYNLDLGLSLFEQIRPSSLQEELMHFVEPILSVALRLKFRRN